LSTQLRGLEEQSTGRMFKFLQIRLGDTKKAYDQYFRAAGLDPNALRGMSPSDQAIEIIRALGSIENAARRTAVAGRLLGEEVSVETLKAATNVAGMNDALKDFDKIGSVLGRSGAEEAIEGITDEVANLERGFTVLKQMIALEFAPTVTDALQGIIDSGLIQQLGEGLESFGARMEEHSAQLKRDLQSFIPSEGILITPPGEETPQEAAERFAAMAHNARFNDLITSRSTDSPSLSAVRAQARNEARISTPTTQQVFNQNFSVKDTDLAREVRRQVEKTTRGGSN